MPRRHVPDGGARNEIFAAADVQEAPRRHRAPDRAAAGRPPQTADPPTTRGEISFGAVGGRTSMPRDRYRRRAARRELVVNSAVEAALATIAGRKKSYEQRWAREHSLHARPP